MRKTLTILSIIIVIALTGMAIWYYFFKTPGGVVGNPFNDALPFGSGEGMDIPTTDNRQLTTEEGFGVSNGKPVESLFQVASSPVAGAVLIGQGASTTVRYVDRATGHIYDTDLATLDTRKVTNTTLPKIYEAVFSSDGNRVIYRSLDERGGLENLAITLTPPDSPSIDTLYTSSATVLRGDIQEPIAGTGNNLFYIQEDTSSVVTSTFEGTGLRTILSSPFTAWRLNLFGNSLVAWTKASSNVPGYAYSLNTSTGSLNKLLGPLNGLTVLPNPRGERVISSYNDSGVLRLVVKNIQSEAVYELSPSTLAEKCVWGRATIALVICGVPTNGVGGGEPDNWYKGITHFSDRIWKFDTDTTETIIESEPKSVYGVDIDATNLLLSQDDGYLIFINRNDLSLWALKLVD
ncbi:MAG: hypothetical protein WDZ61_00815 [Parcubacteria group bacterium]